jgi:hypothetical protein
VPDGRRVSVVHNPRGQPRVGDVILANLADPSWNECIIAVAFARRSGTTLLKDALHAFSERGRLTVLIGVDQAATSREALEDLLVAADPRGSILVCHNPVRRPFNPTFHPKVFVFVGPSKATLIVGSDNLTRGGLFENYEAAAVQTLDLAIPADAEALAETRAAIDDWTAGARNIAKPLTAAFLDELEESGLVSTEARIAAARRAMTEPGTSDGRASKPNPFQAITERGAPFPRTPLMLETGEVVEDGEMDEAPPTSGPAAPVAAAAPAPTQGVVAPASSGASAGLPRLTYVQTLHQTDVGRGQTTAGTGARSAEVFVPLEGLNQHPAFWGYPAAYVSVSARTSNLNRIFTFRLNGKLEKGTLFVNRDKHDLRLRSSAIRNAAQVGDLLEIQEAAPGSGFEYEIQIIAKGGTAYPAELAKCVNGARRPSPKRWGYF